MVGNGITDEKFDGNALVPFAHGMGLISDDMFNVGLSFFFFGKHSSSFADYNRSGQIVF